MPINNIDGETFVAFLDISGFKKMLEKDINEAEKALSDFYSRGYDLLNQCDYSNNIRGLFVSDSAIIIADPERSNSTNEIYRDLNLLLSFIKEMNRKMLKKSIMLTCSIAYGQFRYTNHIEFDGISKNKLLGNGYLKAYLDSEKDNPKLQPGECRILYDKDIQKKLSMEDDTLQYQQCEFEEFKFISKLNNDHFYYFWMVNNVEDMEYIHTGYKKANNCKYQQIENLLRKFVQKTNDVKNTGNSQT